MNLRKGLTVLFLVIFINTGFAQGYSAFFKRIDFYAGLIYANGNVIIVEKQYGHGLQSNLSWIDTLEESNNSVVGPSIGIAFNLPIILFKESSIGAHLGSFIYILGGGVGCSFPLMLQYRFRTDAVLISERKVGFAFGMGYNLFYLISEELGTGQFIYPSISPEINFKLGNGLFKIKAYVQFGTKSNVEKINNQTHFNKLTIPLGICFGLCY